MPAHVAVAGYVEKKCMAKAATMSKVSPVAAASGQQALRTLVLDMKTARSRGHGMSWQALCEPVAAQDVTI